MSVRPCARRVRAALLASWLGVLAAAAAGCGEATPAEVVARARGFPAPVLLVVVGSLRADALELDPEAPTGTPCLARLAQESFVFERAYAASNDAPAAVAALLTGRGADAPGGVGGLAPDGRLRAEATTLAEALSAKGYDARAVVADPRLAEAFGFGRGFEGYTLVDPAPGEAAADASRVVDAVASDLDALLPPPSLLMVQFLDPHWPLSPPAEDLADAGPLPPGSFDGSLAALAPFWRRAPGEANVARARALYRAEVAAVDRALERLLSRLAARGQDGPSWIVVTSDRGLGLWDHEAFGATGELYEAQLRVPLLVRPPHGLPRPVRVAEPFGMADLAPTLLGLLGAAPPAGATGRSWADALAGQGAAPVRPVLAVSALDGPPLAACIDGRSKLLLDRASGRATLHDVLADPGEREPVPLVPGGEAEATATRLLGRLRAALGEPAASGDLSGAAEASASAEPLPGWLRARLAALDAGERDG